MWILFENLVAVIDIEDRFGLQIFIFLSFEINYKGCCFAVKIKRRGLFHE